MTGPSKRLEEARKAFRQGDTQASAHAHTHKAIMQANEDAQQACILARWSKAGWTASPPRLQLSAIPFSGMSYRPLHRRVKVITKHLEACRFRCHNMVRTFATSDIGTIDDERLFIKFREIFPNSTIT